MPVTRLAHVCLHVRDLDVTARFYEGALGLSRGFTFEKNGAVFGFYLACGNQSFIEVFRGDPGMPGNIKHLALEVDDLDGVTQQLRSQGYEISDKKLGSDRSWQAWTTDPDGVRIELHQYTAESRQIVGGICQVTW
jgi:catechol 2,3-dioxygenase-like lactoylglutathione lyase family enzyme